MITAPVHICFDCSSVNSRLALPGILPRPSCARSQRLISFALIARPPAGAAFWEIVAFSSSGAWVPSPWIGPSLRLCGLAWFKLVWNSAATGDTFVDAVWAYTAL